MNKIELHQKRLPLYTKIIEGFIASERFLDIELSITDPADKSYINELLDSKRAVQILLKNYSAAFKISEDFLIRNGVDIDYSSLEMTQDEWRKYEEWESKFVKPYLKKENSIIKFFKSLKIKKYSKKEEIRTTKPHLLGVRDIISKWNN